LAKRYEKVSEAGVPKLHALALGGGKMGVKPTPYRDGQNVIRNAHSKGLVYMPPEARDVPRLMKQLIDWINHEISYRCASRLAIAHYQYATIHPYYDGNATSVLPLKVFSPRHIM
jgi:Fic family protein